MAVDRVMAQIGATADKPARKRRPLSDTGKRRLPSIKAARSRRNARDRQ
jgi:hypothetical protein